MSPCLRRKLWYLEEKRGNESAAVPSQEEQRNDERHRLGNAHLPSVGHVLRLGSERTVNAHPGDDRRKMVWYSSMLTKNPLDVKYGIERNAFPHGNEHPACRGTTLRTSSTSTNPCLERTRFTSLASDNCNAAVGSIGVMSPVSKYTTSNVSEVDCKY